MVDLSADAIPSKQLQSVLTPTSSAACPCVRRVHLSHFFVVKVRADSGLEVGQGDVESTGRCDDDVTGGGRPSCPRLRHERQSTTRVVRRVTDSHDERKSILAECTEQHARLVTGLTH